MARTSDYDFSGWATRNNLKCSDGRIIGKDAFKQNDGVTVPIVWNHRRESIDDVLGHALLENREDGVYAYGKFNETESGKMAKIAVMSGDINKLSIYANELRQQGPYVMHGNIRELSLVLAGANPGAFIENVIKHGEESDEEARIFTDEILEIYHSDDGDDYVVEDDEDEGGNEEMAGRTIAEVVDSMTEEQKDVMYALIGQAVGGDDFDEEDENMKHNVFDTDEMEQDGYLSHADQEQIIALAKQSNVGSFKQAMEIYAQESGTLAHGIFEEYGVLFPEYELLKKGEPETLEKYDQSWVEPALRKIHKSPYSRIRTRQANARIAELKAKGYQNKGDQKTLMNKITMIGRTTDPQTIYIKDDMHRDDIIDVTDFSVVDYQWKMMRRILNETLILAALIGDGREEDDPDKIHEKHVRSIWHDDELYTMHKDVDIAAAKAELQGTNTSANFGDNYIYAEAIITAALYAREKFKGTGRPDFYCTPHLVNVMLLARDLNGRRIYDSEADLAKSLNVASIVQVEQFEGKRRTTDEGDVKELLGLFVNLNDYQFGSTKGGEITKFEDFDMDFNLKKFMLETRLSGSLTRIESAIALELPVAAEEEGTEG